MRAGLALTAVIVMITVAWFVREEVIEGDRNSPRSPDRASITVVCDESLEFVCTELWAAGFVVEDVPAGASADEWSTAVERPSDVNVWVTVAPWPELVDVRRTAAGSDPMFEQPITIAETPLELVLRAERVPTLAQHCGVSEDSLGWDCIAEVAGAAWSSIGGVATWGNVKPGITDPFGTSIGALILSQVIVARLGTPEFGREVFSDPEFLDWFNRFVVAIPEVAVGTALDAFIATPAAFDAVGDTSGAVDSALFLAADSRQAPLAVRDPEPGADGVLVVAALAGSQAEASEVARVFEEEDTRSSLEFAGWELTEDATTGLPDGGTLQVIRERYEEATR